MKTSVENGGAMVPLPPPHPPPGPSSSREGQQAKRPISEVDNGEEAAAVQPPTSKAMPSSKPVSADDAPQQVGAYL